VKIGPPANNETKVAIDERVYCEYKMTLATTVNKNRTTITAAPEH